MQWDDRPAAAALARLDAECFAQPWNAEVYATWQDHPSIACWVLSCAPPDAARDNASHAASPPTESAPHGAAGVPPAAPEAVGWCVCRQIGDEAEVLRLGVHPAWRRHGWGRRLLAGALERLTARGAAQVFLEVRAGNAAAIALYAQAGFRETGRRRGYYAGPPEDALLMGWRAEPRP